MAYYKDIRQYLQVLEERDKLVRIKTQVNKDTLIHPLVRLQFRGIPEEQRKAFLFENITDSRGRQYDTPVVVAALAGSSEIYSIGMMCKPEEIMEKFAQAQLHPMEPRIVEHGPVYDEVHIGDSLLEHGGLDEFPIPISTPGYDVAPYITAPSWVTRDPQTGIRNVGTYRAQVKGQLRTGCWFTSPEQGGAIHWHKCKQLGMPLEAAIVIGGPPSIGYVSVSRFPQETDELAVAGGIAGERLQIAKCKTVNLEVPAHAEIVIEGEIDTSMVEPEAPFGEMMGFVGLTGVSPYFTIKCIAHRKKPIWLSIISQFPPSESSKIRQHANEGIVYKYLRYDLNMSHVLAVAFHEASASHHLCVIQVKKTEPAAVWHALEAANECYGRGYIKIAVDEDINPRDLEAVSMALSHRMMPHRDCRIVKFPISTTMDLALEPIDDLEKRRKSGSVKPVEASCLLINAAMKWPYPPLALPKKEFMEEALRVWQKEGLPELTLKEPWWGHNLGYWRPEEEERATLATRGEYYQTGKVDAQKRRPV